ncbi:transcription factor ICE1-like [Impatiens glandulifera]|uniref:transcription factor ICE1-like n=1 Tax=Impatiens glandulifera TaxID=253017 RepID=UPI001FB09926|nr:transcription factor ICE1-like [Impatiens glandulifera]
MWMENGEPPPWPQTTTTGAAVNVTGQMDSSISNFRSMLGVDVDDGSWYVTNNETQNLTFQTTGETQNNLILNPVDSSASCSPSPASMFTNLDPSQVNYFIPNKQSFQPVLNDDNGFDFLEHNQLFNVDFTSNNTQIGILPNLTSNPHHLLPSLPPESNNNPTPAFTGYGFRGFDNRCNNDSIFLNNRSMTLKPLENFESIAAQPTLFQKRAALRKNFGSSSNNNSDGMMMMINNNNGGGGSGGGGGGGVSIGGNSNNNNLDDSIDGSGLNYDSDDFLESNKGDGAGAGNEEGSSKNGKKKLPAKNLMAERRRRKKLNDRLYMLRSVVPKISKMDRASILGDAIEYLKELLQKINQLHNELETTNTNTTTTTPPGSSSSSMAPNNNMMTSFYPLTPTTPSLSNRIKDELCPASMNINSPNSQPRKIEVRAREGRAVNIHMFCARKPGLLLSTMRAMDEMGLDVQQAVISCFNGFAMDIFRAEQCREGQDLSPEQIKAILLESAGLLA